MILPRWLTLVVMTVCLVTVTGCSKDPDAAKRAYVQAGDRYVAEQKFAEAVIEYRNAIRVDGRFGEARLKLADAYIRAGETANALREYVRAADLMPGTVDAPLKAGQLMLVARRFEDARAYADKVLAIDNRNIDGQILRGNALAGLSDLDGAVSQLEGAIKEDPARASSYSNLGLVQQAAGNVADAEDSFRKAVASNPKSPTAHLALANLYWATNRRAEAERAVKAALEIDAKNLLANRALAMFYLSSGRSAEAEAPLKIIAEAAPNAQGRLVLADYYSASKRTAEAKALLKQIAAEEKGFAPAQLRLASIANSEGDRPGAHRFLDEILAKLPKQPEALLVKAELQLADGHLDEALTNVRTAIAVKPEVPSAHVLHGRILAARKESTESIAAAYQEAIRLNADYVPANIELARINLVLGKPDSALQFAQNALRIAPNSADAHLQLARAHLAKGNPAAAEKSLRALSATFPELPAIQSELGRMYLMKGDAARARAAFQAALTKEPGRVSALEGLVALDLREKRFDSARARIDSAAAAFPRNDAVQVLAGRVYLMLKDTAAAEAAYKRTLAINPNNLQAYGLLGDLYAKQKRLPEATAEFERLVQKQPESIDVRTALAVLFQVQGRGAEAQQHYEKALDLNPRAAVAANNLAWLLAERGDFNVALQLAQTAKAELPEVAAVNDTLGWIYHKHNMSTLAIPPLKDAVNKEPNNPVYHFHLGVAYAGAADAANARQSLQKALALKLPAEHVDEAKKVLAGLPAGPAAER